MNDRGGEFQEELKNKHFVLGIFSRPRSDILRPARSWGALDSLPFKKKRKYDAVHFFCDYDELYRKVKDQGDLSLARIEKFRN